MANIKLPTTLLDSTILVVDDEPEHIEWLIDYINAKGMKTVIASNVEEAIKEANSFQFRGYIIDLNIPLGGWQPSFKAPSVTYEKYLGLYVLKYVRTQGNSGNNVIAYSAHSNEQISSEIETLYCEYIAKGKARAFKDGVDNILTRRLATRLHLGSTKPPHSKTAGTKTAGTKNSGTKNSGTKTATTTTARTKLPRTKPVSTNPAKKSSGQKK